MLELIEKILASFLILALLIFVMFLAFPGGLLDFDFGRITKTAPVSSEEALNGKTPLPKGDANNPAKIVGRLSDSSGSQERIYTPRRKTPPATPARANRKQEHYATRRYKPVQRSVVIEEYHEYPHHYGGAYDHCSDGSCACNCNRLYWARSARDCVSYSY